MSTNKSFSNETSERYSRALFEVASETNELEKIEKDVERFYSLFNTNAEINNFIKDPSQNKSIQINIFNILSEKLNFLNL